MYMEYVLKVFDKFKWCYWRSETQVKIQTKLIQCKNDTEVLSLYFNAIKLFFIN